MLKNTTKEIVIGVLAIVSIVLVAIESLAAVSESVLIGIYIVDLIICMVFVWDFMQRLKLSESKKRFMKTNGYEILAMIPAIALNALGAIPIISSGLRTLRLIRVIRVILVIARMRRLLSKSARFVQRSHLFTLSGIMIGIIFIGAFAVMALEGRQEGAQITNFSDAVWWSISTVTTVGYGDIVPQSIVGRVMGMILMVIGIGVMASFISGVSATLVESRINNKTEKDDLRTGIVTEIKSRIDKIDELTENDMNLLMQMIKTLRDQSKINT